MRSGEEAFSGLDHSNDGPPALPDMIIERLLSDEVRQAITGWVRSYGRGIVRLERQLLPGEEVWDLGYVTADDYEEFAAEAPVTERDRYFREALAGYNPATEILLWYVDGEWSQGKRMPYSLA